MENWLSTPGGVSAILALLGAVGGLIYWMGKVQEHKGIVSKFIEEIRGDIKKIFERLPATPVGVKSGSPLELTDFGRHMAAIMGAQEWADTLAPALQKNLAGKQAFEVDEFSRRYVHENMRYNERVAKCMYETGAERDGALRVLHVVLRDALLARLGMTASDPPA